MGSLRKTEWPNDQDWSHDPPAFIRSWANFQIYGGITAVIVVTVFGIGYTLGGGDMVLGSMVFKTLQSKLIAMAVAYVVLAVLIVLGYCYLGAPWTTACVTMTLFLFGFLTGSYIFWKSRLLIALMGLAFCFVGFMHLLMESLREVFK